MGLSDRLTVVAGLLLAVGSAALLAALEVLLVPLRAGTVLVPVSVLVAVVGNLALPWLTRRMTARHAAGVVPVAVWLVVVLALAMTPRGEGDVLVRAEGGDQYVFYGLLFGGVITAAIAVIAVRPQRR